MLYLPALWRVGERIDAAEDAARRLAVQLVTTPRRTSATWALWMLDEHLVVR